MTPFYLLSLQYTSMLPTQAELAHDRLLREERVAARTPRREKRMRSWLRFLAPRAGMAGEA